MAHTNGVRRLQALNAPDTTALSLSRSASPRPLVPSRWLACAALALGGCALAPGMRMDVVAPGSDQAVADLRSRADLFSIDIPTLDRLRRQAGAAAPRPAAMPADFRINASDAYAYRVGANDVLRIIVFDHPELTNPAGTTNEVPGRVVNSDGKFFFPYMGAVQAAGRTVQQIRDAIADGIKGVVRNPQVDVSVMQYRSQRIVLAGEVRNPGAQPVTDVQPLLSELLAAAGGIGPEADLGNVTVRRGTETARVDLYAYYYGGDASQNVRLQHGDIVHVPDRRYSKVFVMGEVNRPNSLVMPRGRMTLAEALSDSGGVNPLTANSGQVYVIRDGPEKPQIWHLNAASPDAMVLADRFDLQARDVVFVDSAPVVRWGRVLGNILPTADFLRATRSDSVLR